MNRKKQNEYAATGAALILFFLIACHKLDHSSLWFDESIEYWYSKIMFGGLPFPDDSGNMYQRVISTLQPPLYNFLLYFWLKISDTQWWFRFFGVLSGFCGMIGLYKIVKKYAGVLSACLAIAFAACLYRLAYYWQEAAEYSLMLGLLFWTVYLWSNLIQSPDLKNIVLFTLFAVLPVYSQYGAAFPVFALGLSAYVMILLSKNKKAILYIHIAYLIALFCAALPLYILFIRKQLSLQHGVSQSHAFSNLANLTNITFDGGIVRDCAVNFYRVFHWNLFPHYGWASSAILLLLFLILTVTVIFKGDKFIKIFSVVNIFTWFCYYFAVKSGVYANMSYGGFGNRYNLFFIPLWIIYLFIAGHEFYNILKNIRVSENIKKFKILKNLKIHDYLPALYTGAAICFLFCFCVSEWTAHIQPNWNKGDLRGAVAAWYNYNGYEQDKNTLIYYAAASGFAYYARMDARYDPEARIIYMNWGDSGMDTRDYQNYLRGLYGENPDAFPDEIYFIIAHRAADDVDALSNAFYAFGYQSEDLYNHDFYDEEGGRLIRFSRASLDFYPIGDDN